MYLKYKTAWNNINVKLLVYIELLFQFAVHFAVKQKIRNPQCLPYWLSLAPLYIWLLVFCFQPHKVRHGKEGFVFLNNLLIQIKIWWLINIPQLLLKILLILKVQVWINSQLMYVVIIVYLNSKHCLLS